MKQKYQQNIFINFLTQRQMEFSSLPALKERVLALCF